jgi:hypothetical protein
MVIFSQSHADIFTSMGVLLHLYSMDKAKLELLDYKHEDNVLQLGMEFLKAAGNTNTLAARYVTMLQSVRPKMKQNGVPNNRHGENRVAMPPSTSDLIMPEPSANSELQEWGFFELQNEGGTLDLDGMNFDDLLLGTGLPQSFISLDYPPDGSL